jgi:hypothetical protein
MQKSQLQAPQSFWLDATRNSAFDLYKNNILLAGFQLRIMIGKTIEFRGLSYNLVLDNG